MKYKLIYTDTAKKKIEELKEEYVNKLEEIIEEKKFVPGDELLEISGSDLEYAKNQIKIISHKKNTFQTAIVISYLIIGLILIFISIFYNKFFIIFREFLNNPTRLLIGVMGLTMTFVSLIANFLYQIKKRNFKR